MINVLCSFDIDSSVRLSCAAAAVEVWPEALLTPAAADSLASSREPSLQTLDLLGLCMHAYVQHLCQEHRHKESEVLGPARLLERASTTEQRAQSTGKTPLLHWGQSAAAQTAAQLLQQLLSSYWEAQTAELAEAGRKTTSQDEGVAGQAAATLATLAAGKALAELQHLGTTENGDTAKLEQQWVQLGFGLQLMVGVLGWEWAYEQVSLDRHCCSTTCVCQQSANCHVAAAVALGVFAGNWMPASMTARSLLHASPYARSRMHLSGCIYLK